ncbi:MAG TPA: isochorismatase family protein [Ktedonobacterales bacterium]
MQEMNDGPTATAGDALIVVDVQNDFCPGGALPVPEGDTVVPVLNQYLARAAAAGMPIFASRDWHPTVTTHFAAFGGLWPPHCIQGTFGAEFHRDLRLPPGTQICSKGTSAIDDGYSMLDARLPDGSEMLDALRSLGIKRLHVGGLATDYCVRATVLDGLRDAFDVSVLEDASRPVDVAKGDGERAMREMLAAGAHSETLADFAPVSQS